MVVRGIASNKGPDTKVTECMTSRVLYCYEDDDVMDITQNMEQQHVQRLIVLNNRSNKRLSGVVSVSDIAEACRRDSALAKVVSEVSHRYNAAGLH
jgi:predicted transcriptional regulator